MNTFPMDIIPMPHQSLVLDTYLFWPVLFWPECLRMGGNVVRLLERTLQAIGSNHVRAATSVGNKRSANSGDNVLPPKLSG